MKRTLVSLVAVALATAATATVSFGAATHHSRHHQVVSDYPTDPGSRTFATGTGGWTQTISQTGVCVPAVTCPQVTNSFQPSGGADGPGDGYVSTAQGGLAQVGLLATSSGVWQSPAFTYSGAAGRAPERVTFTMSRRANVSALLAVTGASADYTVELIDQSGGSNVTVIDHQSLASTGTWSAVPAVTVNPSLLKLGDSYSVRITTRFITPAAVVPSGSADYDNVDLRAVATSSTRTRANSTTAVLSANHGSLFVRLSCPRSYKPGCKVRATAVSGHKHGKALTNTVRVRIKAGKTKVVALTVKAKYRPRLARAHKVFVREQLRSKKHHKTVVKKLKLLHA
jgi:hypothetical protein